MSTFPLPAALRRVTALASASAAPAWAAVVVTVVSALVLSACGGGASQTARADDAATALPGASTEPQVYAEQLQAARGDDASVDLAAVPREMPAFAAVRFLNQSTFGATDDDVQKLRVAWRWTWLQQQFAQPVDKLHWDNVLALHRAWVAEDPANRTLDRAPAASVNWDVWDAYLTAPDQVRKRVGYALSQIMVVSIEGLAGTGTTRSLLAAGYVDTLERNAFGNFRQLLEEVTLSPAMGYYLSHRGNRRADYPGGNEALPPLRVPDENYAREVMQLFTLGLVELEADGTPKLVGGKPKETYTEADVQGLARVFTGWDWELRSDPDFARKPMRFVANRHSSEEKRFLGVTIPRNTDGPTSLKIALDTLFLHPNVGPFVGRQLIQRLVTSNPSTDYVRRVAAAFADNGKGVRGDMKAMIDAVLRDPEALRWSNVTRPSPSWGKLREPVLRFTTFARAFGAANRPGTTRIPDLSNPGTLLAQNPLHSPSVFNFYRPGYVPPNTSIATAGLVAPEFQITTDTSLPGHLNFMQRVVSPTPPYGLRFDFAPELALVNDVPALVARLNLRLTNDAMSAATRDEIVAAVSALPAQTDTQKVNRVRTAVMLTLASPEYVIQK